jgi:archaeosortase B (VPXXXP-CTERM-specific)
VVDSNHDHPYAGGRIWIEQKAESIGSVESLMSTKKANSNKNQKGHLFRDLKQLKTPLLFCFLVVLLNVFSLFAAQKGYLSFFEILTAQATTGAIHLFGMAATQDNTIIRLTNDVWQVKTECTAITIMIIFASFVIVYQTSLKAKSIGLLAGIPFIFAANIARLLVMAFIDKFTPASSAYFHEYLWQAAFILMVVFMWFVWAEMVVKRERKTAVAS